MLLAEYTMFDLFSIDQWTCLSVIVYSLRYDLNDRYLVLTTRRVVDLVNTSLMYYYLYSDFRTAPFKKVACAAYSHRKSPCSVTFAALIVQ